MKKIICLCAMASLAAFASAPALADDHLADDLVIVSWGGAYAAMQNKAFDLPYLAMNPDVTITNDTSAADAVAKLRAMSEANNLTWDLVDVIATDAIRLCDEGLAMEIDHDAVLASAPDGTSASDDFGDKIISPCYIPHTVYSTTFGYRTDLVGDTPPTNVCDVFDLETYPGKRSLEKRAINNLEWALICDGVAPEDVYDVLEADGGVARALAKLDTIKDHVIWWNAGADTPQLLADGEVVMGSTYNGRLFALIEEAKQPVAMLWDRQIFDLGGWIVPSGLPEDRLARVFDYLNFATDTERLANQAKYISYGPSRASSAALVSTHAELGIEMAPHMPTAPANATTGTLFSYDWWADYRDDMEEAFSSWLSR